ncbi:MULTISPECIES: hypothetical protein [unclassified Mesorhizobium]|uniref:hypothetical protein n=1 Tax=unclassified Mesorhizobium TaxID=325217 RepID=UPI000FCB19D3|nr:MULTISPECIES: hypothetical protein [unclassified Mesorhizobium]TGP19151.1 hypothetical protein EN874_028175 [Mesorhizobium sp. M1D.F.Ca.ET.231.01.1.1]TGP25777.1 hypothetical protein EN877_28295 [Mesorhizobium sp. M1D.F.Ca.ET.234.01.1.1]TGS40588.1 hypothetical protein EN827_26545 [Mesorhizobium sp. M1D.F.Ca.ET.184.01.1.1]TGS59033.1 hypothetical protein EN826_026545 [Mesorhizobium sp. M1D.F.Ca.ET.183.01.1.1]
MHFDGAPAGHQAKLSGTTKGRPKIEAGKIPGPSWSALQASSQGTDRAALTVVIDRHAALLSRRSIGYTAGGQEARPQSALAKMVRKVSASHLAPENSYYSGLYVDEDNRLALVDPGLRPEDMKPSCSCCTHTFNGEPFTREYEPI